MQYAIAMIDTSGQQMFENGKRNRRRAVHYIPCINREHADDMLDGLRKACAETYSDGPFVASIEYELVYVVLSVDGRRIYLDESEIEMIVSEYTTPKRKAV